jgi:TonB family protein
MLGKAWDLLRRRPMRGLAISLALHGLVVALMLLLGLPAAQYTVKRGEPLFVELPELPEPPPRGNPAAKSLAPPRPETPTAAKRTPPAPPARPAPPAPPAPPPSPAPLVATRPATPSPPPSPDVPLPDAEDLPTPAPRPETPAQESAPPAPPAVGAESGPPAGPQVASVPPSPEVAPPVDIRSALGRGGGAGSAQGGGRGGIEGEPIPLDSTDPSFSDFLDRVRRQIKANWGYPCIKNGYTRECDYKTARLVVEFGVLKAGRVQFVEVRQSSGFQIYDDYAVNAIKLGSPFPPVPDALIARMKAGSRGAAIVAVFNYVLLETTLTNILR